MDLTILGIESSCDDTSAAVLRNEMLLSNVMAGQEVHSKYGGVIPELASRAHQQNIVPVVDRALKLAEVSLNDIDVIAFTRGPGLLGSLLVGTSFAKGLSLATGKPIVDVNHLQGHLLSPFIKEPDKDKEYPHFPFISLIVSGGHTQIIVVESPLKFKIIGQTIDDAVGEAFDKCAKMLCLGYPGGPIVDKYAKLGNSRAFNFAKPKVKGFDYSFSGVKTSLLYFLRDKMNDDKLFISNNINDICASFQKTLIDILMEKLLLAVKKTGIREVALGGGVSANSALRERVSMEGNDRDFKVFLPEIKFTTDNAAMIAIAGYFLFKSARVADLSVVPVSRVMDYK